MMEFAQIARVDGHSHRVIQLRHALRHYIVNMEYNLQEIALNAKMGTI